MKKFKFCILMVVFLTPLYFANSQETKWIRVGSLHSWYADRGCEIEEGRVLVQQDGLRWPAFYAWKGYWPDCEAAKGLWIGCKNFTDQNGINYPFKIAHVGPRGYDDLREFMPKSFKMYSKYPAPKIYVDGNLSTIDQPSPIDEINPTQVPDRILVNEVKTSVGISMKRTIYAFSQEYNDNYFIYDYVFTNTGDVDLDDDIEFPNQTLEGVYFFFQYRWAASREGCSFSETGDPTRWGHNALLGTRGDDPNSTDEFRCQFERFGKYSKTWSTGDNIGAPKKNDDGHLGSTQYVGIVTIHCDKSPTDKTDDKNQPSTTSYESSDDPETRPNDQYDKVRMAAEYKWMERGHKKPRHEDYVKDDFADLVGGTPGGYSACNGYGPYTLKPGESIHIVLAEGVAGINRDLCYSVGAEWLAAYKKDPGTGKAYDVTKNNAIKTGQDSLFQTFRRAIANWKSGFTIPQPPSPPEEFTINSGGDRISLSWSKNSEKDPGFAGYKIFRADSAWDNRKYTLLFQCGKNTGNPAIVNQFDDRTAVRGFSYYYYIQAFSDGSTSNGIPLYSNRQYTQTYDPAFLRRQAGTSLDEIRVVPNPYNIKAQDLQYKGEKDKIMFLNIPGECTIKIYTERGDLIKEIIHNNGSGDESWNSITSSNQVVVSGVYIVVFETPTGGKTFRKFVVIR